MRSTTVGTILLLASAGAAQTQSESVVTEIPSSLIQTTEQVFTIQTSVPTGLSSVCYEVCVQEPCYACSASGSMMSLPVESLSVPSSVPPVSMPSPISTDVTPVPLPVPTSVSISDGDVTMTLPVESLPPVGSTLSVSGSMSIPQGETPESTGVQSTSSGAGSTSASGSAPAEQTAAAAPPSLKGNSTPLVLALGISGISVLFGAARTLF